MAHKTTAKPAAAKTGSPADIEKNSAAMAAQDTPDTQKSAAEIAEETGAAAKDRAGQLSDKAKAQAAKAAEKARGMADAKAEEAKSYATGEIDRTAEQIREAGRQFGAESYQSQAADYVAQNLSQAADHIRDKDLGDVVDDVSRFARRNPALFLGGAALLGFGVARLMKASSDGHGGHGGRVSRGGYVTAGPDVDRFDDPPAGVAHMPHDRRRGDV
ncbi:hypothetical protein [Jannaschia ovalis]|uniref:Late embryogenesis abundant protein n=1 Tax=Jannaschia ovalis TaxID=3038773 RepID=A0ABY8LH84_9RHOB|nr:hypothetical protein [Jannaschia sp. GRR-S6-38]WGH79468.1 hypothetical protein P8627_04155 [Jannaschia sp. GRR-S6-38]